MSKTIETNKEWTIVRWTCNDQVLVRENSFGIVDKKEPSEVEFTIGIHIDGMRGYFEMDGGDDDWYAEGSLDFDGKNVIGYDGVFELPMEIEYELEALGYDLSEL